MGLMQIRDKKGLTEQEFLAAYAKKNYPRPALTADLVVFSLNMDRVLLVKRGGHPFLGCWAFPGGFANADESVEQTALRELQEETGISTLTEDDIYEIGLFSTPGRDPRGWVVSNVYAARIDPAKVIVKAGDDAAQAHIVVRIVNHLKIRNHVANFLTVIKAVTADNAVRYAAA